MNCTAPPKTHAELLARARRLAGRTIAELAAWQSVAVPRDQRRAKGWIGQLVERALGADAGNLSAPDFVALGVELKTIPVDHSGSPRESTYVCTLSVDDLDRPWRASRVYGKLAHVLWVPVEASAELPIASRHIGSPLLWRPGPEDEALLRRDWEEHIALARIGELDEITGDRGVVLQLRPKGANAREVGRAIDASGAEMWTLRRGFYLRASFTGGILRRHFAL